MPDRAATPDPVALHDDIGPADPACPDGGFSGDWPRASPAEVGFDEDRLREAVGKLRRQRGTRRVVVARHGRVVLAESWAGSMGAAHDVKSASKSLLGTLVGIAIERGEIEGLDQPIADFFPELRAEGVDARKRRITIRHLLSMTSGLASTSGEHYGAWVSHSDWVAAALDRPVVAEPGETFIYSTGNTHLLSAILTQSTGLSTHDHARRVLLGPIGAEVASWAESPKGIDFGGNSVRMTALDLARLGQLHLDGGRWCGEQVVPGSWIEHATRRHAEGWPDRYGAYGFTWWLPGGLRGGPGGGEGGGALADTYLAVGYGGQFLLVAPRHDALVVVLSDHAGKGRKWDRQVLAILRDGVLGAIER